MSKMTQAVKQRRKANHEASVKASWQAMIANAQRDLRYARERGDREWIDAATVHLLTVQSNARGKL